jgi:hypothetical protein
VGESISGYSPAASATMPHQESWVAERMVRLGYMLKRVALRTDWLDAPQVTDIYSLSGCVSEYFDCEYHRYWKHNGYWLFDSPDVLDRVTDENGVSREGLRLFYYEAYPLEHDETEGWREYRPEPSFETCVTEPAQKTLEGFDVTTFSVGTSPECSPLSCNSCASSVDTNEHCLLRSLDEAIQVIEQKRLGPCEPGPYRIIAVYSVGCAAEVRQGRAAPEYSPPASG